MSAVDLGALGARVTSAARRTWPRAEVAQLAALPGGISSLTFRATLRRDRDAGVEAVVVKVSPPGLEPVRNRDVLRQARVMAALAGAHGVAVPRVLLTDGAPPPLFVMEFVVGEAYEPRWDLSSEPPAPPIVDGRARAAARMLARLHAVDPAAAGLSDEPVVSVEQELERWARLYATAGEDLRGKEGAVRDALAARVPAPVVARVAHGDYRLGNMQFDGVRPTAIIDWEIWSVGDPRGDLAWLMVFCDPVQERVSARDPINAAAAAAMPDPADLLAEYLAASGADRAPEDLKWFMALGHYKLGATMSVLAKRNRRRADPDPGLELAARTTPPMLDRALALLS